MINYVKAWDLPLRLFKWALVMLVIASPLTKWYGSSSLYWHKMTGYMLLTLIIWRILWGFWGSDTAKFKTFFPTPRKLLKNSSPTLSHAPFGSLMIFALLGLLTLQILFGFFSTDDIIVDGPFLYLWPAIAATATKFHYIGFKFIWIFAIIHIAANLYYQFIKKQPIISAMVTGQIRAADYVDLKENSAYSPTKAILFLIISAVFVFGTLIKFGKSPF
jgi:cytochrome b